MYIAAESEDERAHLLEQNSEELRMCLLLQKAKIAGCAYCCKKRRLPGVLTAA
jgi:hypothetical protein